MVSFLITCAYTSRVNSPNSTSSTVMFGVQDVLRLIAFVGTAAGLIMTKIQIRATDFHVDMIIYRAGAQAFLENRPLYFQAFSAGDLGLPFIYPPFGALILGPLAKPEWITDEDAAAFVVMLSSLGVLLCLYLVASALLNRDASALKEAATNGASISMNSDRLAPFTVAAVLWPLALLSEPVWLNSQFAQINVVVMTLVVLDLMPRHRRIPQGWLIGLAAAIKLTPLVMLLYFVVRKEWRGIASAGVSAVVMTAIGAAFSWSRTQEFYTRVLFQMGSGGDFGVNSSYTSNSSIHAFLERWWSSKDRMLAHQHAISLWWLVLSLITIAIVFFLMRELVRRGYGVEAVMLNSALMLLVSPVSWSHHWVWIPLWIAVLLWHWRTATTVHGRRAFAVTSLALSALVLFEPPKWWFGDGVNVWELEVWKKIVVNDYTISAYLLFVFVFVALRFRQAHAHDAHPH